MNNFVITVLLSDNSFSLASRSSVDSIGTSSAATVVADFLKEAFLPLDSHSQKKFTSSFTTKKSLDDVLKLKITGGDETVNNQAALSMTPTVIYMLLSKLESFK